MKLQPESKKELTRIACGTAICTAVMWVIFAALHLVGWVKFDYTVVLGSLIGAAVAIGNFAGICIVCQKVIDEQDEKRRNHTDQARHPCGPLRGVTQCPQRWDQSEMSAQ